VDALQAVVTVVLIVVGTASILILFKLAASYLTEDQEKGVHKHSTLRLVILVMLFTPTMYACTIGAFWLLFNGWEGLTGMLLTSGGDGLALGVFFATILYIARLVGRRHWRGMEKEMETVIKTKRPVPQRTTTKAVQAITALVLGTAAFDVLVSMFSTIKAFWQTTFLLEAGIWFVVGLFPFLDNLYHGLPIRGDEGAKLWVIVLMTVAAIFVLLSVLVPYIA
jgi:hypothetical protein